MLDPGSTAATVAIERCAELQAKSADAEKRAVTNRAEINRLKAKLEQIATVCRDNAGPTCDKGMALDFVRQIAES